MRKSAVIFCLLLIAFLLFTGCSESVTLHQSEEDIIRIDFLYSPFHQSEVLYTLPDDQIITCAEEIQQLTLRRSSSPSDNGGTYILRITYADGAVESLGSWSVSYTSGGTTEHEGWYYVSKEDLYNLFSQYIDPVLIPVS